MSPIKVSVHPLEANPPAIGEVMICTFYPAQVEIDIGNGIRRHAVHTVFSCGNHGEYALRTVHFDYIGE